MKTLFLIIAATLMVSACGTRPKTASHQGQEGHGGDLAVTRARTALYLSVVAEERRTHAKEFRMPTIDLRHMSSIPTWKIISSSELSDQFWEWQVEENGRNVLVVNRERMRTATDQRLMEESSILLFGYSEPHAIDLMPNDLEHSKFRRQNLAELFGTNKAETRNRILAMFNKIRNCRPEAARVGGHWHQRFRDARAEVLSKSAIIEQRVATLPLEKSEGELFASAQNAQVDFLSQHIGPNQWKISQDIARSEGWESHQSLISAVLTHEVAHTLGLTTVDSDYIYSFATLYCM